MHDTLKSLFVVLATLGLAAATQSAEYKFAPNDGNGNPSDIWDLDHTTYCTWGISDWTVPEGEQIVDAVLAIHNINNWTATENGSPGNEKNWLYLHLLDSADDPNTLLKEEGPAPAGKLKLYYDYQNGGDNFANWTHSDQVWVATYSDYSGGPYGDVVTLSYSLAQLGLLDDFIDYLEDGENFGWGFDSDCHYWNDGVDFVVTTRPVPEGGSTAALLGTVLIGLGVFGGRRRA